MTTITINGFPADEPADTLWQHFSSQQEHQPVFAQLDTRDGEWTVDYSGEIGNAVPVAVWRGTVLRFDLDCIPTAAGANRLLERTAPAAQRLLDAYEAQAASDVEPAWGEPDPWQDEIDAATEALQDLMTVPDEDMVAVWHIDGLASEEWDEITAGTSDADVERFAASLLADLAADDVHPVAVCHGLVESLLEERDSKRAAAAYAYARAGMVHPADDEEVQA